MSTVTKESVKEGQFFKLKGDSRKYACQVMECWDSVLSVKVGKGIMDKPYEAYELVTDIGSCREIHYADYFEDKRKSTK